MEIKKLEPKFKEGFKINYTTLKKSIMKCEVEKAEKNSKEECKKIFKELNIELLDG